MKDVSIHRCCSSISLVAYIHCADISEILVKKNECKLAQNLVYRNENGHIICDSFVSKEVNSKGKKRRVSNKQSIKKIKVHENGH